MKTGMTSFDVAAFVSELSQIAKSARIENIYQIDPDTFILRLHIPNKPAFQLLVESGKRIHLTSYSVAKPPAPPTLCMTLRKYLVNGRIQAVEQHGFERSIAFRIETRDGSYQLIVELFGGGNIILVDPNGAIVTARTFKRMRDRNIIRSETFRNAPSSGKNPFHTTREQIDELRNFGELEAVRALTRFLSIGGLYAEELLVQAGVDKNTPCKALTHQQFDSIYAALKNLIAPLSEGRLDPAIIINSNGEMLDVIPIRLKTYEGMEQRPFKSFNEGLDEYYTTTTQASKVTDAQKEYEKELGKQQRVLEEQQKTLEDSKHAIAQHKRTGDLVYAHFSELQQLLQFVIEQKQTGKNWDQITEELQERKQAKQTPTVYFDSLDPKNQMVKVSIEGLSFSISMKRSIQANAADYYERMKKAQRKLGGAEKAFGETREKIRQLQNMWMKRREEVRREAPAKQASKAWYEKFRWFRSSDGFLIVGGKDAITNEILVKKHTESHDIVFHAEIAGAPFVVVKTEGKTPSDHAIQESAQFAASFSRAWREMLSAIDVYWIRPEQISKSPPPGQYLEKGSFIIQGARNYVRRVPLRVGVGLRIGNEQLYVVCGPVETVLKGADFYVEIAPGKKEGKDLAKEIRNHLVKKAPKSLRERILAIPNSQLLDFLPFGRGEITLK